MCKFSVTVIYNFLLNGFRSDSFTQFHPQQNRTLESYHGVGIIKKSPPWKIDYGDIRTQHSKPERHRSNYSATRSSRSHTLVQLYRQTRDIIC